MFTVETTTGSTVQIDQGTRITSIAGRACDVIITGVSAEDTAARRRGRVLSKTPVILQPFIGVNPSTLQFEYDTPVTVLAQTEEVMMNRWVPTDTSTTVYGTSLAPKSEVDIYLNNADDTQDFGILFAKALDPARALMSGNQWEVSFVTQAPLTPEQEDAGERNTDAGTPTTLTCIKVDQNAQYESIGGVDQKTGDAMIIFTRDQATESQLQDAAYFSLSYLGQDPALYTIWNENGIRYLDSYHYRVSLQRMK